MILDDGGDATMLIHLGARAEAGDTAFLDKPGNEEEEILFAAHQEAAQGQAGLVQEERRHYQGRQRRDHDGRASPLRDGQEGPAPVAGDQRQRLGDKVEVRQSLRLQGVAGRRHPPRHRRDDGRQGRDGRGLRRRRQGFGGIAAQRRLPRDGLGNRSDLRIAGGDGRLRSRDDGRSRAARRHFRDRDRQPRRHHRRPHACDERSRHRLQHRSLRFGNSGRRPEELQVAQHQAAGRRDRISRRQAHHPSLRRPPGEPRQRDGSSRAS